MFTYSHIINIFEFSHYTELYIGRGNIAWKYKVILSSLDLNFPAVLFPIVFKFVKQHK